MPVFDPGAVLSPLAATGEGLAAWQIGLIAFAFIGYVLVVAALLERWEVRLHA
jgi:hypothetical protein